MTEMKYFKSIDGDILGNTVYLELDNGIEMELAITVSDQLQVLCYRGIPTQWMNLVIDDVVTTTHDGVVIPKLRITPGYAMDEADEPDSDRGAERRKAE